MPYYLPGLSPGPKPAPYSIPGLASFTSGGGTVEYTPFGTPIYVFGTGEVVVGERARSGRVARVAKRIVRYIGLGSVMYLLGWAAGMYLPLGWTATVSTGVGLAGGARATILVTQDLSRIGFLRDSAFLRTVIAGKVGVAFAFLPIAGAFHGTVAWTIRETKRTVKRIVKRAARSAARATLRGMGSLGGNLWSLR